MTNQKGHKVPEFYMGLVEDIDSFNRYPWGTVVFEETQSCLKTQLELISGKIKKEKESYHYNVVGFPLAVQIWAYECIPPLGEGFSNRIDVNKFPRILCWESTDKPESKALIRDVFNKIKVSGIFYVHLFYSRIEHVIKSLKFNGCYDLGSLNL